MDYTSSGQLIIIVWISRPQGFEFGVCCCCCYCYCFWMSREMEPTDVQSFVGIGTWFFWFFATKRTQLGPGSQLKINLDFCDYLQNKQNICLRSFNWIPFLHSWDFTVFITTASTSHLNGQWFVTHPSFSMAQVAKLLNFIDLTGTGVSNLVLP